MYKRSNSKGFRKELLNTILFLLLVSASYSCSTPSGRPPSATEFNSSGLTIASGSIPSDNSTTEDLQDSPKSQTSNPNRNLRDGKSRNSDSQSNGLSENTSTPYSPDDGLQQSESPSSTSIAPLRTPQFTCVVRLIKTLDEAPPQSQVIILRLAITKGVPTSVWYELQIGTEKDRGLLRIESAQLTEKKFLLPKNVKIETKVFGGSEFYPESKACEATLL